MAVVGHRVKELLLDTAVRFDAHLLPGDSTAELRDSISVRFTEINDNGPPLDRIRSATNATADPDPAVTVEYDGGFEGSEIAPHHAMGVTFDWQHGIATADDPLPAADDRLQNFMVRAIATAHNGAEVTNAECWVRVHIHGRLQRIWLTPNPLTVKRDSHAFLRLTVLGEFDDGVVADLTQFERTVPDWNGRFTWETDIDTIATVSAGGRIQGVSAGTATITCRVAQPGAPEVTATAQVEVTAPWSAGAEVKLEAGDADRRADVPNVLFLPEGFEHDDEFMFDQIVDVVIDRLAKNHLIDPWPMVHKSVNFWSAFLPGRDPGMTRHLEVYVDDPAEDVRRPWGLSQPKRPKDNATKWSLEEMVYMIGLPVPIDTDTDIDDLLPRLRLRFGDHVTKERIEKNYGEWIKFASRKYIDDVDSTFHLAKGERTRARIPDGEDQSIFELDSRRIETQDISEFLGGLHYQGNPIGTLLWGAHAKDRGLVCVLTRSSGRSVAPDDYFVCSLAHGVYDSIEDTGTGPTTAVKVSPIDLPDPEFEDLDWLTYLFAHECGHAFGLGDEYGESDIDKSSTFATTDDNEAPAIEHYPNLTTMATLRTGTAEIDATRIKWGQWLRIADAGVVVAAPSVSGTRATVEIRDGDAKRFKVGDLVRLRKRLCRRGADNDLEYRAFTTSGRLKVAARPDDNHVVFEADGALATGEAVFADFAVIFAPGEGTILFKPTRQSMPGHVEPTEVTVMSPLLTSHLTTTDKPLNAKAGDPYVCQIDSRAVQEPRNLPILPTQKPCYEPLIIGLYDGGRRNHCGTFHPGGVCMMRDEHVNSDHRRFCQVCRYVLVDMIDPTKHGALDAIYAKEYAY